MMLVLSRQPGESIYLESAGQATVVTVLNFSPDRRAVWLLSNTASREHPGRLDARTVPLAVDGKLTIRTGVEVSIVELKEHSVRLGIQAPPTMSVHRLEVYEEVRRKTGGGDGG